MDFRLSIDGETSILQTLVRFTERADDASEALDEMGDIVARLQTREFDTQGGATRSGWAARCTACRCGRWMSLPPSPWAH